MLLPTIWAPSSLQYTSLQNASVLHLGSILTANTSVQDASALTAGLHPHCQISQFGLGSILTAKYLSSGCFCPNCWAPSSLPNTSVQDTSAFHLGSILTAKYFSSGCFCPPSGLHPHYQIPQFRMLLPSILTAKYLSSGCFCPLSGLHPHCQIPQFRMLLPSIWAPSSLQITSVHDASARRMKSNHCRYIAKDIECTLNDTYNVTDRFFCYIFKLFKILIRNFQKVRKIYRTTFCSKIMKINHCFFLSQVFRHNNLHFQKLLNWAELRQHPVSDKLIIY